MEVFKIKLEPTRIVRLPFVTDLKWDQLIPQKINDYNHFYSYAIHDNERIFPETFALNNRDIAIVDYIGIKNFNIWIVEPRRMFVEGDRIIIQMKDRRLFAGKSKLLTDHSLILRDNEDINCDVLDFADVHFIGRFARGISTL
ncbi:hypothetical protein NIE88_03005 [Sporolactobacillus shoreicorticis]|uniref:Peptidase S24/S26A/S26B/S26C domain-containing protein n=1 Tax=Sporolactobacillus shoreicorticis TaxID=1923877 RepID=A0ABW5RZU9_9BACL|nr:hypothetical protein [Sporolactobacillus shoreicorticis]MCO7124744.1 hypothetical protein [Sporolactobacillus shoreicorticis]